MINFPQADYLSDYEKIVTQLESDPQNFDLKHKAVLALARMGSLDFARQEFGRYELDKVRHHEDIQRYTRLLFWRECSHNGSAR